MGDDNRGRGSAAPAPPLARECHSGRGNKKSRDDEQLFHGYSPKLWVATNAAAYPRLRSLQRRAAQASLRKCRCSRKSASYLFGRFHARKNTSGANMGYYFLSKRLSFGLNSSALDNKKMLSGGCFLSPSLLSALENRIRGE
jgi:hypothetical protein